MPNLPKSVTLLNNRTSLSSRHDRWLIGILQGFALLAGVIALFILAFLIFESLPILQRVEFRRFFTDPSWHPTTGFYNLRPMLWGSVLVMVGSVLMATPLGILSAIFSQYYAPALLAQGYRRLIELLAGIPSVVYGFWGLVVLVPLLGRIHPPGTSLLAGIVILTLMILPTVCLVADTSLEKVPISYLHGAIALGLSRWATIWRVVLPAAKSGLLTGLILASGRAIGETMAVSMVCGNVVQLPQSVFDPMRTLSANIALEMAYAIGDHRSALFFSGLLLMGVILSLVAITDVIAEGKIYG